MLARMLRRLALVSLLVLSLGTAVLCAQLASTSAQAQDAALSVEQIAQLNGTELSAQVRRALAGKPQVELRRPLEQAQLALQRMTQAAAAHDEEGVERNLAIARAALALSETRRLLLRERALLAAALRRKVQRAEQLTQSKALAERAKARLTSMRADAGVSP